jgi:hypothetical protein
MEKLDKGGCFARYPLKFLHLKVSVLSFLVAVQLRGDVVASSLLFGFFSLFSCCFSSLSVVLVGVWVVVWAVGFGGLLLVVASCSWWLLLSCSSLVFAAVLCWVGRGRLGGVHT